MSSASSAAPDPRPLRTAGRYGSSFLDLLLPDEVLFFPASSLCSPHYEQAALPFETYVVSQYAAPAPRLGLGAPSCSPPSGRLKRFFRIRKPCSPTGSSMRTLRTSYARPRSGSNGCQLTPSPLSSSAPVCGPTRRTQTRVPTPHPSLPSSPPPSFPLKARSSFRMSRGLRFHTSVLVIGPLLRLPA